MEGFGRCDSVYSPPFYVRRESGVGEAISLMPGDSAILAYPNPFIDKIIIKFATCNPESEISLKIKVLKLK